jgi:hypothetical protein
MQSTVREFREEAIPFVIYNPEKRCKYFTLFKEQIINHL